MAEKHHCDEAPRNLEDLFARVAKFCRKQQKQSPTYAYATAIILRSALVFKKSDKLKRAAGSGFKKGVDGPNRTWPAELTYPN